MMFYKQLLLKMNSAADESVITDLGYGQRDQLQV